MHDWHTEANCLSQPTSLFFPSFDERSKTRRQRERVAKAICQQCTVISECLRAGEYEQGIWGGLTERERQQQTNRQILIRSEPPKVIVDVPRTEAVITIGSWVVVDQCEHIELWQRSTTAVWHGMEWAIVKHGTVVKTINSLENAYIGFNEMLG